MRVLPILVAAVALGAGVSQAAYHPWKNQNRVFGDLAAVVDLFTTHLTGSGEPEELPAGAVKANFFQRIGVRPLMGRTFLSGEERRGREHVVILSYQLWHRRFGGDPGVLGRSITLGGGRHEVIGILPPDFTWNNRQTDVWVPYATDPGGAEGRYMSSVEDPVGTPKYE